MSGVVVGGDTILDVPIDDNQAIAWLCGPNHAYVSRIENELKMRIALHETGLRLYGGKSALDQARLVILTLLARRSQGEEIELAEVDNVLRSVCSEYGARGVNPTVQDSVIETPKRRIHLQTPGQLRYLSALERNDLVLVTGPAGTGKTYLAVAYGVYGLIRGRYDRLIFSRPAVEAGERLGYLPGDVREKIDPYLRPLLDALYDMLPSDQIMRMMAANTIELAPLAFMRGRTLAKAFVVLDEGQNTTHGQLKMFLTRMGRHSSMVVTGDLSQVDLPSSVPCGLSYAIQSLSELEGVGRVELGGADIMRHDLVARIVAAYHQDGR